MKPRTMVDMAKTPKEVAQETAGFPGASLGNVSKYPYGLCIRLDQDDLEKLDLEPSCEVGDMLHLFAMAKVTSVSNRDTEDGMKCNIELQVTHLGIEDEDAEDEGEKQAGRAKKRYGGDDDAADEASEDEE